MKTERWSYDASGFTGARMMIRFKNFRLYSYQRKEEKMQKMILCLLLVLLSCGPTSAGILGGRIIREDGSSLAKTEIVIEGKHTMTNEFGGYAVELTDGERELNVVIDGTAYTSERITIYTPRTKQNWRLSHKEKKLIRIR